MIHGEYVGAVVLGHAVNNDLAQKLSKNLDIGIGLDLTAQHLSGTIDAKPRHAGAFADHLEWNLLEIQDNVGGVFHHARNRAELVRYAFNSHGSDGCALDRAKQYATQASTDGRPESTLERLCRKHSITLGERLGVGD